MADIARSVSTTPASFYHYLLYRRCGQYLRIKIIIVKRRPPRADCRSIIFRCVSFCGSSAPTPAGAPPGTVGGVLLRAPGEGVVGIRCVAGFVASRSFASRRTQLRKRLATACLDCRSVALAGWRADGRAGRRADGRAGGSACVVTIHQKSSTTAEGTRRIAAQPAARGRNVVRNRATRMQIIRPLTKHRTEQYQPVE